MNACPSPPPGTNGGSARTAFPREVLALTLATATLVPGGGAAAAPAPFRKAPERAVVQEILDSKELYIDVREARVGEQARTPQSLRTEDARGQLGFGSGAAGRLNRRSMLRLGAGCFLLDRGQILVSGRQSACTRSSRMSTRGTNYVVTVQEGGAAELVVLEGEVEVWRVREGHAAADAPVAAKAGVRARFDGEGSLLSLTPLTAAEVAALLRGPLFRGFRSPLPAFAALRLQIQRTFPSLLSLLLPAPPPSSPQGPQAELAEPLLAGINGFRVRNGRPAYQPLPPSLATLNATYALPVLERILATGDCDHDLTRWNTLQSTSAAGAPLQPTSEILACPRRTAAWDPQEIVNRWSSSTLHTNILLNRPRATHMGCVRLERGGRIAGLCTAWTPAAPPAAAGAP